MVTIIFYDKLQLMNYSISRRSKKYGL